MAEDDTPAETLKRATTACLRAIAERDDVTVSFGGEPPGVAGTRARLPAPSRLPTVDEVAKMRGAADAIALRLRYHDAELHAARMPKGEDARAAFEALEQARCEAIGASADGRRRRQSVGRVGGPLPASGLRPHDGAATRPR